MADWIMSLLAGIPLEFRIFLAASLPITELRAAIPVGIALGLPPGEAFTLGVLGNLVPIITIIVLLPIVYRRLQHVELFDRIFGRLIERARRKGAQVEKYGAIGLILFVALPVPGTGAWSGCLLAFVLGINIFYATLAITIGVFLAGIAVTLASLGFFQVVKYLYDLETLAVVGLAAIIVWWMVKKKLKKGSRF